MVIYSVFFFELDDERKCDVELLMEIEGEILLV